MVLGLLTTGALLNGARGARRTALIVLSLLFLALLIGSECITGVAIAIMLAVVMLLLLVVRGRRLRRPVLFATLAIALFAGSLTVFFSSFGASGLLDLLGRDTTLTGRTELWQVAIDAIRDRPVLGYGYDVFWAPIGSSLRFRTSASAEWMPYGSHNGFLDTALDLGVVGEVLVIIFLVVGVWRASALFWRHPDRLSMWPLCAILFGIATNLTEASFARYQDIRWIIIVAAFFLATDACQRGALSARTRGGRDA